MNKYDFCIFLKKLKKNKNKDSAIVSQHKEKQKYYVDLEYIHKKLKPKKYLEIGVRNGVSIVMANKNTECIGIDPYPAIKVNLSDKTKIFDLTSDEFFEKNPVGSDLVKNIDLAFIDGMHLFEFVLRDFINTEKCCHKNSIILLHDTMPKDEITSRRDRCTDFWTGDVFKMILILKKYRPDLSIYNLNSEPSGLAVVKNLDPTSKVLEENYEEILKEYTDFAYTENINDILDIKPSTILKNII